MTGGPLHSNKSGAHLDDMGLIWEEWGSSLRTPFIHHKTWKLSIPEGTYPTIHFHTYWQHGEPNTFRIEDNILIELKCFANCRPNQLIQLPYG